MSRLDNARALRQRVNMGLLGAIHSGGATISQGAQVAEKWAPGLLYAAGEVVAYKGQLYKCTQVHTSQSDWTPEAAPALWAMLGLSEDDPSTVPAWVQPLGAHDAYSKGAKVQHAGKTWTSTIDGNTWEPGIYGWEEAT
jgi:hypothetical protein